MSPLHVTSSNQLTFSEFSNINWARCRSSDAFNDPNEDPLYLLVAIAEEVGELCGAVKKLHRGFNKREQKKTYKKWVEEFKNGHPDEPIPFGEDHAPTLEGYWREKLLEKIRYEVADVYTYLDLFCKRFRVNFAYSLIEKFNQVSDEMHCPQYKIIITHGTIKDQEKINPKGY